MCGSRLVFSNLCKNSIALPHWLLFPYPLHTEVQPHLTYTDPTSYIPHNALRARDHPSDEGHAARPFTPDPSTCDATP